MKKVYKKIISFSISLLLVIGIIIEFRLFIDMNKLLANINEYTQDESISLYKAYSPGDIIYFDPVSDDDEKVYKIKRLWIPQTGNILIDYTSILGYTALIVLLLLLFEINKQRIINKRLRK